MLDEDLLEEAVRLSGEKTYSDAVRLALRELVRRIRAQSILELRGSGLWKGNLGEMREDRPAGTRHNGARSGRKRDRGGRAGGRSR